MLLKLFKNKFFLTFLLIFIFNLLFFYSLIIPKTKSFITPEIGGGDSFLVSLPYQYELCKNIKQFKLPFWSSNLSFGYPLLAEGEIGAFNPINIFSCLISDYKIALNWQIVLHNLIGQIGIIILGGLLGLSIYSSIFFALIFSFSPFVLMNYMHFPFIRSIMFLPYIFIGLIQFYRHQRFKFFLLASIAVGLQFIASHYQISFISIIFAGVYLVSLLCFSNFQKTKKIKILIGFITAVIVGLCLVGFQLLPAAEFYINSSRSTDTYAVKSDQGLSIKNLMTIVNPYFFGNPRTGTYPFAQTTHPWEGTFFVYYSGLVFLLIFIFIYRKIKNQYTNAFLISFLIIFLFALGQNSPLYLVHYLPPFSSLRFPSRFVFILIFVICYLVSLGFNYFIYTLKSKSVNKKRLIFLIILIILFIESKYFFESFHVLEFSEKLFIPNKLINYLEKQTANRYFFPVFNLFSISKMYVNQGYLKNSDIYYQISNHSLSPNINLIYNLPSFNNKTGPQLKRFSNMEGLILADDKEKNDQSFPGLSQHASGVLYSSGIKYIISFYELKESNLQLEKSITQSKIGNIYLYSIKDQVSRIQFFKDSKSIESYSDYQSAMEDKLIYKNSVLLERNNNLHLVNKNIKLDSSYKIIADTDTHLSIKTTTNRPTILYLADTYYPGWEALINKKPTEILRANLFFRAVQLPAGDNLVEFIYRPKSFYFGVILSIITSTFLIIWFLIGKNIKTFLKVRLRFFSASRSR